MTDILVPFVSQSRRANRTDARPLPFTALPARLRKEDRGPHITLARQPRPPHLPVASLVSSLHHRDWSEILSGIIHPHNERRASEWDYLIHLKKLLLNGLTSLSVDVEAGKKRQILIDIWGKVLDLSVKGVDRVMEARSSLEDMVICYGSLALAVFLLRSLFGEDVDSGLSAVTDVYSMVTKDGLIAQKLQRIFELQNSALLADRNVSSLCYFLKMMSALHGTDQCGLGTASQLYRNNPLLSFKVNAIFNEHLTQPPRGRSENIRGKPVFQNSQLSFSINRALNKTTLKKEGGASALFAYHSRGGALYGFCGGCGVVTVLRCTPGFASEASAYLSFQHGEVIRLASSTNPLVLSTLGTVSSPPSQQHAFFSPTCPTEPITMRYTQSPIVSLCALQDEGEVERITLFCYQKNRRITATSFEGTIQGTKQSSVEIFRGNSEDSNSVRAFSDLVVVHSRLRTLYGVVDAHHITEYDIDANYRPAGQLTTLSPIHHINCSERSLIVSVESGVQVFDLQSMSLAHEEFFARPAPPIRSIKDATGLALKGFDGRRFIGADREKLPSEWTSEAAKEREALRDGMPRGAKYHNPSAIVEAAEGMHRIKSLGENTRTASSRGLVSVVNNFIYFWGDLENDVAGERRKQEITAFRESYNFQVTSGVVRTTSLDGVCALEQTLLSSNDDAETMLKNEVHILKKTSEWTKVPANNKHMRGFYHNIASGESCWDLRSKVLMAVQADRAKYFIETGSPLLAENDVGLVDTLCHAVDREYKRLLAEGVWEKRLCTVDTTALAAGNGSSNVPAGSALHITRQTCYYNANTTEFCSNLTEYIRGQVTRTTTSNSFNTKSLCGTPYIWRHKNPGLYRRGDRVKRELDLRTSRYTLEEEEEEEEERVVPAAAYAGSGSDVSSEHAAEVCTFPHLLPHEVEREVQCLIASGEWRFDANSVPPVYIHHKTKRTLPDLDALKTEVLTAKDYLFTPKEQRGYKGKGHRLISYEAELDTPYYCEICRTAQRCDDEVVLNGPIDTQCVLCPARVGVSTTEELNAEVIAKNVATERNAEDAFRERAFKTLAFWELYGYPGGPSEAAAASIALVAASNSTSNDTPWGSEWGTLRPKHNDMSSPPASTPSLLLSPEARLKPLFKKGSLLLHAGNLPLEEANDSNAAALFITSVAPSHRGVYIALHCVAERFTSILHVALPVFEKLVEGGGEGEEEEERVPTVVEVADASVTCHGCVVSMIPMSEGVLVATTEGAVQYLTLGIIRVAE